MHGMRDVSEHVQYISPNSDPHDVVAVPIEHAAQFSGYPADYEKP